MEVRVSLPFTQDRALICFGLRVNVYQYKGAGGFQHVLIHYVHGLPILLSLMPMCKWSSEGIEKKYPHGSACVRLSVCLRVASSVVWRCRFLLN